MQTDDLVFREDGTLQVIIRRGKTDPFGFGRTAFTSRLTARYVANLLTAGFDTAAIMRAGGWKSVDVLARYLENAEQNVWKIS